MAAAQKVRGVDRGVEVPYSTSETVAFNPGDLMILSSGNATPIGSVTITTSFLGVCAQRKPAAATTRIYGNSTDGIIRVDTDGEYDFDCDDTVSMTVGTRVAPSSTTKVAKAGDGTASNDSISVGVVTKQNTPGSGGRVRIKINSSVNPAAKAS